MKRLLWFFGLLLALAACTIAALPLFVDESGIRDLVQDRIKARFGPDLVIRDGLSLSLLPTPVLSLHDVSWATTLDSGVPLALHAPAIDLHLALLPLLQGAIGVQRIDLKGPDLELGQLAPMDLLRSLLDSLQRTPDIAHVSIDDGQVRGPLALNSGQDADASDPAERQFLLDSLSADFRLDRATGRIETQLRGALAGQPLELQLSGIQPVTADSPLPFQGRLRADGRLDLRLSGDAGTSPSGLDLSLDLDGSTPGFASLMTLVEPLLDDSWGKAVFPAVPARLKGHLALDTHGWRLTDLDGNLADTGIQGGLRRDWDAGPLSASLSLNRPGLASGQPLRQLLDGPLGQSFDGLAMQGSLRLTDIAWNGQTLHEFRTDFSRAADGSFNLEGLTGTLPGNSRVDFTGSLKDRRLAGRIGLSSAALPALLDWSGLKLAGAKSFHLGSLEGRLDADPQHILIDDARLRLDAAQGTGRLEWRTGATPGLDLDVSLDRQDLTGLAKAVASQDDLPLDLDLKVDRAELGALPLGQVQLAAGWNGGAMKLRALSIADAAGLHLNIGRATADGSQPVTLTIDRPARLAAATGSEQLALLLARSGSMRFEGRLIQADEFASLELAGGRIQAGLNSWQLHLAASSPALTDLAGSNVSLELHAPQAGQLLDEIGLPMGAVGRDNILATAPLDGVFRLTPGDASADTRGLTFGLTLGPAGQPTRLISQGLLALSPADDGGLAIKGGLELDDIGPAGPQVLRLLAATFGLPVGPAASWLGDWPTRPLAIDWQSLPTLDLRLNGLARIGAIQLSPAKGLALEDMDLPLLDGRMQGSLKAAPADAGIQAETDLRLTRLDGLALLAALDMPVVLGGPIDLDLEAKAQGPSLAALVGQLTGQGHLASNGGMLLAGIGAPRPYQSLRGDFTLDQGKINLAAGQMTLNDGDPLPLQAGIDLPAWTLDLSLGPEHVSGNPRSAFPP